jgi:putative ATPase
MLFERPLSSRPLAFQRRPQRLDDYVGQKHLLASGKPIQKMIEAGHLMSLIFWGPPGCGKTSLARLLSHLTKSEFKHLNAVTAKIADLKAVIDFAKSHAQMGQRTILFLDEIHRFNKTQQDALLPDVESGLITLIGATTENPFFSVIPGLVSRCQIFELYPLEKSDLVDMARDTMQKKGVTCSDKALDSLASFSCGDARKLLNAIELACTLANNQHLEDEQLPSITDQSGKGYSTDDHYDLASALIKSMRGSDPDAAVYWLARLLHQGEPAEFIARRLIIFASEDIGNADPQAFILATSLLSAAKFIGMPEIRINLSHVTTYLASAPKSNASYVAINKAQKLLKDGILHPVPNHLRDAHYAEAKRLGHGKGYKYPHDYPFTIVDQDYMPQTHTLYEPTEHGAEKIIKERLNKINPLKKRNV